MITRFPLQDDVFDSGAEFSPCQNYRYSLWRIWDASLPPLAFVGLNPSVADIEFDDRTIRRCIGFARRFGHGGLYMLNLFAFIATKPTNMKRGRRFDGSHVVTNDPVGPENDAAIRKYQGKCSRTIVAWGKDGSFRARAWSVIRKGILAQPLECLKVLGDGSPGHPLYIKGETKPIPWGTEA